jgi:hypothetical protein
MIWALDGSVQFFFGESAGSQWASSYFRGYTTLMKPVVVSFVLLYSAVAIQENLLDGR